MELIAPILTYTIISLIKMIDPFTLIGSVVAGLAVRRFWLAMLCGSIWGLLVAAFVAQVALASRGSIGLSLFATQLVAALCDTALAWAIANAIRRRGRCKHSESSPTKP
jgi:hypothetical protein